jgi:hypothetical protein
MSTTELSTTPRRVEVIVETSASGWTSTMVLGWEDDHCSATCISMLGPLDAPSAHDEARERARQLADTLGVSLTMQDEFDGVGF